LFGLNKRFRKGTTIENENKENIVERITKTIFNVTLPQYGFTKPRTLLNLLIFIYQKFKIY
jgi:hypothetical protein